MNLKTIGKYALIALYGVPTLIFTYMFFRFVFDFPLSDIIAIAPAFAATYLIATAILRSKMSSAHKVLAATVITVTIVALVIKLLALQIVVNKLQLIVH